MDRKVSDKTILDRFVEEFTDVVEKHTKYIIVSGFVAIAHGRSRGTEDIDMIIERISKEKFSELHEELINSEFECMQSDSAEVIYSHYLQEGLSVRYTWKGEFLPEMEVKLAKDVLDNHQIKNRIKLPFTGLDIWFSSIEGNIAFKEELLKSGKDMEDAKHLRIIYKDRINEKEIEEIKSIIREVRLGKNNER